MMEVCRWSSFGRWLAMGSCASVGKHLSMFFEDVLEAALWFVVGGFGRYVCSQEGREWSDVVG